MRQSIRRRLLQWYDRHARDLPWRRRPGDPYAQWVAEVMLQQTQVQTVLPYYERFLARFPNVRALAAATEQDLLRAWQGLGYYRRAAHLHRAARRVAEDGGQMPRSCEALRMLPGVGRYTAGAIASITFDERVAAVDGNVARVIARLFCLDGDVSRNDTVRRAWTIAECLLPRRRCGDFNQALMDLGATVCTPAAPRCDRCPLRVDCMGRCAGDVTAVPVKRRRVPVREVRQVAMLARCDGSILMRRRPPTGLWAGLWELPCLEYSTAHDRTAALHRLLVEHQLTDDATTGVDRRACPRASAVGGLPLPYGRGSVTRGRGLRANLVGRVTRRLTHRVMHFDVYVVDVPADGRCGRRPRSVRWVSKRRLSSLPISTACRKVFEMVEKGTGA